MKAWKYILVFLIGLGAISCTDELVQPKIDDDPIIIPPPPPDPEP